VNIMQSTHEFGFLLEVVLVLGGGTAGIVGLAALAEWFVKPATWKRTTWRAATLAIVVLVPVELTGTGSGLVWVAGLKRTSSDGGTDKGSGIQNSFFAGESCGVQQSRRPARNEFCKSDPNSEDLRGSGLSAFLSRGNGRLGSMPHDFSTGSEDQFAAFHIGDLEVARTDLSTSNPELGDDPSTATAQDVERASDSPILVVREAGSGVAWWLGLFWLLGSVVFAIRVVWSRLLLFAFTSRAQAVCGEAICGRVGTLARRMGIRRPVRLVEAAGLTTPVAFGSLRPTIALPVSFSDDFDHRQQQVMLAHELAHLSASDPAWQWVVDLTTAGLWWHPLVWWSRRRLRATSETVADEASLLVPQGPDALASCLVELGRRLTQTRPQRLGWLSAGGSDFRSGLGRRVQRLLDLPTRSWRDPARTPSLLVMTTLPLVLVFLTVFCTAWGRPQATLPQGETTMKVLQVSWHRSLAASAMVPLLSLFSGDALSDDAVADQPESVIVSDDSIQAVELALLGDEERDEAEARERREAKERGQRVIRKRTVREREEREEIERAERREREEVEERERARHGEELEQEFRKLKEKAEHIERELREHPDGEKGRELRAHLGEIRERMEDIRRELDGRDHERAEHAEREARKRAEHAARERDERARHVEELKREYHGLQEKAQHIQRKLKGLRDDQGGEARELQGALREIQERMEQIVRQARGGERERHHERERREAQGRERRVAHGREMLEKRRELEGQAHQIRRKLEGLRDGQDEEARGLQAALREIEENIHRMEHQVHGRDREREVSRGRLEEMKRAHHHAREAGREEEAEHIRREMAQLAERMEGHPPVPPTAAAPAHVHRQLEEVKGAVRQLHGQMEEMRHQMEEMRRVLKAFVEHERHERDEDEDDEDVDEDDDEDKDDD